MNSLAQVLRPHAALERGLDSLRPWLLLAVRAVGELAVPEVRLAETRPLGHYARALSLGIPGAAASPNIAAVAGTLGELLFPTLLVLGLLTRVGALGLFAVNAMAVISYWQFLGAEGNEAALAQHVLWGFMLIVLAVCGGGALTLDQKLGRR